MATCEVCGNEYDKAMEITVAGGTTHVFDSFECAIHAIAPRCAHCGCAIIGRRPRGRRRHVLLCPLRPRGRARAARRPHLTGTAIRRIRTRRREVRPDQALAASEW